MATNFAGNKIMKKELTPLEQAIRLLSVRPHAEKELLFKLIRRQVPAAAAAAAVAECKRLGYLNDGQLAEDTASLMSDRGYGPRRMQQQLRQKGVNSELIASALGNEELDHISSAREAANYKLRLLSRENDSRKKRDKLYRFLLGRGFPFEVIKTVVGELGSDLAPPED